MYKQSFGQGIYYTTTRGKSCARLWMMVITHERKCVPHGFISMGWCSLQLCIQDNVSNAKIFFSHDTLWSRILGQDQEFLNISHDYIKNIIE